MRSSKFASIKKIYGKVICVSHVSKYKQLTKNKNFVYSRMCTLILINP